MFQQAEDFRNECDALDCLLQPLPESAYAKRTLFKDWTLNDIVGHLHMWNWAADLAVQDPAAFQAFFKRVQVVFADGGLRQFEYQWRKGLAGLALREAWRDFAVAMSERIGAVDPRSRVQWAGPDMSVRSSITARQMETWAHAQAIYDFLGVTRQDTDRIRNIAVLGVNTFAWTFRNRGLDVPSTLPRVRLTAPSGAEWNWHDAHGPDAIEGSATEFCQVVTQVRNIADTGLEVQGDTARHWMQIAQCFAGPPETPPAPGARYCVA